MFETLPTETLTPTTVTVVGEPVPEVNELTLGVFDLTDTGFVSDDPAVLIWLAAVTERGLAW